jgi:hypothetical protein
VTLSVNETYWMLSVTLLKTICIKCRIFKCYFDCRNAESLYANVIMVSVVMPNVVAPLNFEMSKSLFQRSTLAEIIIPRSGDSLLKRKDHYSWPPVQTSSDPFLFAMKLKFSFFIKESILMRRSIILSHPF